MEAESELVHWNQAVEYETQGEVRRACKKVFGSVMRGSRITYKIVPKAKQLKQQFFLLLLFEASTVFILPHPLSACVSFISVDVHFQWRLDGVWLHSRHSMCLCLTLWVWFYCNRMISSFLLLRFYLYLSFVFHFTLALLFLNVSFVCARCHFHCNFTLHLLLVCVCLAVGVFVSLLRPGQKCARFYFSTDVTCSMPCETDIPIYFGRTTQTEKER